MGFFSSLFNGKKSKETAKKRLQIVLMHDRLDISPEVLSAIRKDMVAVITKYMDVEDAGIEVNLNKDEEITALSVSVPVKGMKRGTAILSQIADNANA